MAMSGGGGGGDTYTKLSSAYFVYSPASTVGDSDFVATIATLPGGANLTYNAPSAGDEDFLSYVDEYAQLGQLVLHNTTRGNAGLVAMGWPAFNGITLAANVPAGWLVGDTITLRSQVCNIGSSPYYFDVDVSGFIPAAATVMYLWMALRDTGAGAFLGTHPYETYSDAKTLGITATVGGQAQQGFVPVPMVSQRFCIRLDATGANTCNILRFRIVGYELPA